MTERPTERSNERTTDRPIEWTDLGADGSLASCVRGSVREIYGYVALLAGHRRDEAEAVVRDLYVALAADVSSGAMTSVTLARLRTAARRLWLARHRPATPDDASAVGPASTLADLSDLERTVVVLRHVNRMPPERVAEASGVTAAEVDTIERRAADRLGVADRGFGGAGLRPWFGDAVRPRPTFVEALTSSVDLTRVEPGGAPVDEPVAEPVDEPVGEPEVQADPAPAAPIAPGAPAAPSRSRRGAMVAIGAVAVVVAVVAAGAWFVTRDDAGSAAVTTPPTATVPAATTSPALDEFVPACVERTTAAGAVAAPDPGAAFAPLGAEPAVVVSMPGWNRADGEASVRTDAIVVDGGVVVSARNPVDAPAARSLVARVGLDGTPGWVRCFDDDVEIVAVDGGAAVLLAGQWTAIDLATGTTGDPVPPPAPRAPAWTPADAWPDGGLGQIDWAGFRTAAAGSVVIALGCAPPAADPAAPGTSAAPATAGAPATTAAALAPVDEPGDCERPVLRAYTITEAVPPGSSVPGSSVAVEPVPPQLRWERAGVTDVVAVRDGYALIRFSLDGGAGGWYLVRLDTGEAIEGQAWGPDRFPPSCCGDASLTVEGGVVLVITRDRIAVWLPLDAATDGAPVEVALP